MDSDCLVGVKVRKMTTRMLMMMMITIAWSWRSIGKSFCFEKPTTSQIGECWTMWRMT